MSTHPADPCLSLDEKWLVTDPLAPEQVILPTRIVTYSEGAPACSIASSATHETADGRTVFNTTSSECTYATTSAKQSFYIPDVEAYTLQIQHSVAVPILGTSWTKDEMVSGSIVDAEGKTIDPCNFYKQRNPRAACPYNFDQPVANNTHYISVGVRNVPDIVSVGTLLEAAGVKSLDTTGLPITDSYRYGGLTLVVQITYDNFFDLSLNGWQSVKYSYKVTAIPGKVKGVYASGNLPATTRTVFEKSGLRVLFNFAGKMGKPSWQAAFTSLMSISQAFGIAAALTGLVITYLLRLSPVYARYITASTHDFSAVKTKEDFARVAALFEDEHVLHPPPPPLHELISSIKKEADAAPAAAAPVVTGIYRPPGDDAPPAEAAAAVEAAAVTVAPAT